ncbi:hypothetical protein BU23DRAFT_598294 [Bimuria novae-zelandiae CBS 107.79]|uniref:Uncharacterized protein n=1 Tax=Bimuria novae-zelandiae CBS 107.79 TaxID=1447943 RepID=A0A6A5VBZ2_9PLEO|nr:hypothetical protein BU23DRAFT_598294 [Bimuria novae-zelandiae CBS 107.79]
MKTSALLERQCRDNINALWQVKIPNLPALKEHLPGAILVAFDSSGCSFDSEGHASTNKISELGFTVLCTDIATSKLGYTGKEFGEDNDTRQLAIQLQKKPKVERTTGRIVLAQLAEVEGLVLAGLVQAVPFSLPGPRGPRIPRFSAYQSLPKPDREKSPFVLRITPSDDRKFPPRSLRQVADAFKHHEGLRAVGLNWQTEHTRQTGVRFWWLSFWTQEALDDFYRRIHGCAFENITLRAILDSNRRAGGAWASSGSMGRLDERATGLEQDGPRYFPQHRDKSLSARCRPRKGNAVSDCTQSLPHRCIPKMY